MQTLPRICRRAAITWLAAVALAAGAETDDKSCAVVLLHGKSGTTASLAPLAKKLKPACVARTVEMPWSQRRGVDREYASALKEVAVQVKELRQQGYKRVLVAGHDMGANAAVAYAAEMGNVDGVIAMAPLQDASGLGHTPGTAARIRQHIPLLWVIGARDPLYALGEDYAYAKAPPHPLGRYAVVQADHAGTPEAAVKPMLEWIKALD